MATEPELVLEYRLSPGDRVAVIGAGGTTRLLSRLGGEWAAAGGRPWIAATTRLDERELGDAVTVLRLPDRAGEWAPWVAAHPLRGRAGEVVAIGVADPDGNRLGHRLGPLPQAAREELASLWPADLQLIKADGTRGQPFKAHAEHEPEIPARVSLVIAVVGLWVLGRPLVEEEVHRAERACELWGYAPGEPVDSELVFRALVDPAGYRRRVPPAARYAVFLNHRGEPALTEAARALTARLGAAGVSALGGDLRSGGA